MSSLKVEIPLINIGLFHVRPQTAKWSFRERVSSAKTENSFKTTLWSSFGDVIVDNLKRNIDKELGFGYMQCEICGVRITHYKTKKFCQACFKNHRLEQQRIWIQKKRSKVSTK